jgi:putative addiction module component (TIGR02574 family)
MKKPEVPNRASGSFERTIATRLEQPMHPAMDELSQLPATERLELVQELWDSIRESREELPVQHWHREVVKARLADFGGDGEGQGISREQVWQQVDQRRGS